MIYEDELNPKVASIMKKMNFLPGMGLGKNQQGPPEFVEPKVPFLKHGMGYQKSKKSKGKAKKQTLWETFVAEGTNYPYNSKPEPVMISDKLVQGFEIFTGEMSGTKEIVAEEPVIEELVQFSKPEEDTSATKTIKADDQRKNAALSLLFLSQS